MRAGLVGVIGLYRLTVGAAFGGRCRFYPSCSAYAIEAIREGGAVRGVALALWRVLRCSPLSGGGVDHPPSRRREAPAYEGHIRRIGGSSVGAGAA